MWGHNVDEMQDTPDDTVFSQVIKNQQKTEQEDVIKYDEEEEPVVEDYEDEEENKDSY